MESYSYAEPEKNPVIDELPNPFRKADGTNVQTPAEWEEQRIYLKGMLAQYLYGHMPQQAGCVTGKILSSVPCYGGKALTEELVLTITRDKEIELPVKIVRPVAASRVPVVIWNQNDKKEPCPLEKELVCNYGYALTAFSRVDFAADSALGRHGKLAQAYPEADWGVIAMWAWGHSRIADYLLTTDWADGEKLIVTGHSRGGKAALCAAIYDERFAVCAPSGAGCGGTGCFRFMGDRWGEGHGICETAGTINDMAGYWWCDCFAGYGARNYTYTGSDFPEKTASELMKNYSYVNAGKLRNERTLPFDMHFAKALIAPRCLITTDGLGDTWSNPYGTQITWRAAQEVFDYLGVADHNALYFHNGGHKYGRADWQAVLDFCEYCFGHGREIEELSMFPKPDHKLSAMEKMMQAMDWKNERHHYSWRSPQPSEPVME